MRMWVLAITCVLFGSVSGRFDFSDGIKRAKHMAPELFRTAPEMISLAGYEVETHRVKTKDGYLITLHRLPPRPSAVRRRPVLMMHGLALQTDYWIAQGPNHSLPYLLADRGYDVWIGNARGNIYSEAHVNLDPKDEEFWNFSWHEIGLYDVPAFIDYVLTSTKNERLLYVGHSMGITTACVLLSTRPEYNSKIIVMIGLAPAIFGHHSRSTVVRDFVKFGNRIQAEFERRNTLRFLPFSDTRTTFIYYLCRDSSPWQEVCEQTLVQIAGYSGGLNKTMLPMYVSRLSGASLYTVMHFVQLVRTGKFAQRDLGREKNLRAYNSSSPPEYDLSKVIAPLKIYSSSGDALVPSEDTKLIKEAVPNVIGFRMVPEDHFNHLDFLIHVNVKQLLYDDVLDTLSRY